MGWWPLGHSIMGPIGPPGPPGPQGPTGETGPAGEGGGVPQASFDQLEAEVVAARGNRSDLNRRITAISNFASPNAGGVIVGQYYDNAFHGTANATLIGAANRIELAPFYTSQPLRIDQIGVSVSTAVNGSELKLVIYGSTDEGWPDELLFESLPLSSATVGYRFEGLDVMFDSGRQYWLGVRHSSTATLRTINLASAVNLGCNGSNAANYFTVLRRTVAFADPAPNPWVFSAGDRVANIAPPSIRMRAAALL